MLNEAAKKLVAREARIAVKDAKDRIALGANEDQIAAEAWRDACTRNPDFRDWPSAQRYFETVFYNRIAQ